MKTFPVISFFLMLLSTYAVAQSDSQQVINAFDKSKIALSFENLKAALLNEDGNETIKYVNSRTINYYAGILKKARTLDSIETEKLPMLDKAFVFITRHNSLKDKMEFMTDTSFFIYAVEHRMVGSIGSPVGGANLDTITINKDSARAQLMVNDQRTGFPTLSFYKENNYWKVDLISLFPFSYLGMAWMVKNSGLSETRFLLKTMQQGSSERTGPEI